MRSLFILCALFALGLSVSAQDAAKPWTEWSKKDVERILNESSWGQTFVQEASGPVDTTVITGTGSGLRPSKQGESGEYKGPAAGKYRARFLTAKPVR